MKNKHLKYNVRCTFAIIILILFFFQAMTIVAATLVDLVRNLKAFAGILIVSTCTHIYSLQIRFTYNGLDILRIDFGKEN